MTDQDSSQIITQDDGEGNARQALPDVELKDGLRRVFTDKEISKLVYETVRDGRKLKKKWYESPLVTFVLLLVTVLGTVLSIVFEYGFDFSKGLPS